MITNYNELSIGKYVEILSLMDQNTAEEDTTIAVLSLLSGKSEEEILAMPLSAYASLASEMQFLAQMPKPAPVAKEYNLGDFTLELHTDAKRLIVSQYVDYQELSKEPRKYYVEMLSCLLIPKGKKYNQGYDLAKVQKAIREELPVTSVMAIVDFFAEAWRPYMVASRLYSAMKSRQQAKTKAMKK